MTVEPRFTVCGAHSGAVWAVGVEAESVEQWSDGMVKAEELTKLALGEVWREYPDARGVLVRRIA